MQIPETNRTGVGGEKERKRINADRCFNAMVLALERVAPTSGSQLVALCLGQFYLTLCASVSLLIKMRWNIGN